MSECHHCGQTGGNAHCPVCGRFDAFERSDDGLPGRLAHEFGLNLATAIEVIAWLDGEQVTQRAGAEELRALNGRMRQAMHVLIAYQAHQQNPAELRMSARVMALVLGFETAAGARESAELGLKMGLGKQTVNKCLNLFLKKMGMEKLPGQRDARARRNMQQARQQQLQTTP